jgi:hypothetical protein
MASAENSPDRIADSAARSTFQMQFLPRNLPSRVLATAGIDLMLP